MSASRGLSASETLRLIGSYDLGAVRSASDPGEETIVERFDLPRSSARRFVADAIERIVEARATAAHVPGSRLRNFKASLLLRRLVTTRYAFPAYVISYRHRRSMQRTVISGHDSGCILGDAPYSPIKILIGAR